MRDFKYYSLITGETKWRPKLKAIRSEYIRAVSAVFASNLTRTASLAFTPVEIAYRARRDQRFEDFAAFKATGNVEPQLSFLSEEELPDAIQWYSVIFKDHARQIFKDNRDLNALSAYRNSLIHNSGRVDKDFIKQVECVPDLRGTFRENQELVLDGAVVRRLRNAAISTGVQLIQLADETITPTPTTDADDGS